MAAAFSLSLSKINRRSMRLQVTNNGQPTNRIKAPGNHFPFVHCLLTKYQYTTLAWLPSKTVKRSQLEAGLPELAK
jgi:hypothetical protein